MTYKLHLVLTAASRYVSSLSMLILNCHLCLKRYKKTWWNTTKNYTFLKTLFPTLTCTGNMSMVQR